MMSARALLATGVVTAHGDAGTVDTVDIVFNIEVVCEFVDNHQNLNFREIVQRFSSPLEEISSQHSFIIIC
jgi:hypothetical protein